MAVCGIFSSLLLLHPGSRTLPGTSLPVGRSFDKWRIVIWCIHVVHRVISRSRVHCVIVLNSVFYTKRILWLFACVMYTKQAVFRACFCGQKEMSSSPPCQGLRGMRLRSAVQCTGKSGRYNVWLATHYGKSCCEMNTRSRQCPSTSG